MGILNIGSMALQANSVAIQTTGNNIANVNTPGYSRQRAVLQQNQGQFTGAGYIGKGVSVQTIQRNYSDFLNRQATLATATEAADTTRADKLKQLEGIFEGGPSGLGASINDMLNAFSDVASTPTDLTSRTVVLTRIDETAARMRSASRRLDDLQAGVTQEISQKVTAVNSLTQSIASVNGLISKALGSGQSPNDLLDRRDQLVRELNRFIKTTSIPADDGSIGLFVADSQAIVLGNASYALSTSDDDYGDPLKIKLSINSGNSTFKLDDDALAGGELTGLIRFQNNDLNEGRNLLGRLTMAISSSLNDQHKLGLDLDGNPGGDLVTPVSFSGQNILQPRPPAAPNTGLSNLTMAISDVSKFAASDYQMTFDATGLAGVVRRLSDGTSSSFDFSIDGTATVDGIRITNQGGAAAPGDRYLLKPFSSSAADIQSQFSTPRSLAVASPVAGTMGATNKGSLQQISVVARTNPPTNVPVTLTFDVTNNVTTYTRSDDVSGTAYAYTSGTPIEGVVPTSTPLSEWSVLLQGQPKTGDTFTVVVNAYPKMDAGNATALMNLRDIAMFDGAALTDGYAGLISQIGIRTQSANYAAEVSTTIAANLEKDRAGVSGVNLDEEAANLLQYQQAYQASAKMIQIAQSIFDALLASFTR